jgi:hypothetical protein
MAKLSVTEKLRQLKQKLGLQEKQEDQGWQAKIDLYKEAMTDLETPELARRFSIARARKRQLEEEVSLCSTEMEAMSQLLVQNLQNSETQSVHLNTGETVFVQIEVYPANVDKDQLRAWVMVEGMLELLTVNYQTLAGLTKERLINGQEPPPGVEVFLKSKARVRGGNASENGE